MRLVEKFRGDLQSGEFGKGRRGTKTTGLDVCYFVVGDDVVGLGGVGEGEGEGLETGGGRGVSENCRRERKIGRRTFFIIPSSLNF